MPSHQERVAKNYDGLCSKCLTHNNRDWDEVQWPYLCEGCSWLTRAQTDKTILINKNILRILERYPTSYVAFGIKK